MLIYPKGTRSSARDQARNAAQNQHTTHGKAYGDSRKEYCEEITGRYNKTDEEEALCSEDCPHLPVKARAQPVFPEPEGDDGSLEAVAARLYTRINSSWQTRILRLLPGPVGSALAGDLLVADIVLRPGLGLHEEGSLISYQALSYCCGESGPTRRIRLNDEELPITDNLYCALQALRQQEKHIFLWVDAICIHQGDPKEKSQQVTNMFNIYHKAQQVDVWLGGSGPHTNEALEFLSSATESSVTHMATHQRRFETIANGVIDVFERPYFQRIWVKQEVYAADDIIVHCGFTNVRTDIAFRWTISLALLDETISANPAYRHLDFGTPYRLMQGFHRAVRGDDHVEPNPFEKPNPLLLDNEYNTLDIINVIRRCTGSKSSLIHDQVYALLGMSNLKHEIGSASCTDDRVLMIDYSRSAAEVFTDLTRHIIKRDRSLAVLLLKASARSETSVPHLPSWVPDFRYLNEMHTLLTKVRSVVMTGEEWYAWRDSMPVSLPRFEHAGLHAARLIFPGRRIGTIDLDIPSEDVGSYQICTRLPWNIFHEKHVHWDRLPEKLEKDITSTLNVEVWDLDLQSICLAIRSALQGYVWLDDISNELVRINLTQESDVVSVILVTKPKEASALSIERSPDDPTFICPESKLPLARCIYPPEFRTALQQTVQSLKYPQEYQHPSSYIVPKDAQRNDIIVAALDGPIPMVLRPGRASGTYRYIGHAIPCQFGTNEAPTSHFLYLLDDLSKSKNMDLVQQFVLE